jgi:hypothetical protein
MKRPPEGGLWRGVEAGLLRVLQRRDACLDRRVRREQPADGTPVGSWLVLGEVAQAHIARHLLKDGLDDTAAAALTANGTAPTQKARTFRCGPFDVSRSGRWAPAGRGDQTSPPIVRPWRTA